jgi:hypothetical protein
MGGEGHPPGTAVTIRGSGGVGVAGSGVPAPNAIDRTHYFTGRSDNFDPARSSTDPHDARFDTESIRVSNDRRHVYISDEYGPYVYQFDRATGQRIKSFELPTKLYASNLSSRGSTEISICRGRKVLHSHSFNLGAARLQQRARRHRHDAAHPPQSVHGRHRPSLLRQVRGDEPGRRASGAWQHGASFQHAL